MKKIKIVFILLNAVVLISCFEDIDDNPVAISTINDFVWKGMNAVYLYKSDVDDLNNADNNYARFNTNEAYNSYLNSFDTPEALFESLKHLPTEPNAVDRFSRITDNYFDLQNQQQGISVSKGIAFNLYLMPNSQTEVYGAITLVLNNSVADNLGVTRGMIFRAVNGVNLTTSNFENLLLQNAYTLNFANYNTNNTLQLEDDTVVLNNQNITLTGVSYTENPIHLAHLINISGIRIGYLMYNGFNSNFNTELNDTFAMFRSANVNELVIDLRYNGGGSIQTAAYLGSMITGQYTGSVFSKLFYNENLQSNNRTYHFTNTIESGHTINSLNLPRVYVLTTNRRTASASELLINSLKAYPIEVIIIGENTVGKTQASITIYDSPTFSAQDINPTHYYAMQPLVANSTNVNDELVLPTGIPSDIPLTEVPYNLGVLGSISEPLLAAVIANITGTGRFYQNTNALPKLYKTSLLTPGLEQDMYIESVSGQTYIEN